MLIAREGISLHDWRTRGNVPNRPMANDISKKEEVGRRMTLEFLHSISYGGKVLNFRYKTLFTIKDTHGVQQREDLIYFPSLVPVFRILFSKKCQEFFVVSLNTPVFNKILCNLLKYFEIERFLNNIHILFLFKLKWMFIFIDLDI